jgi:hypothetical protein
METRTIVIAIIAIVAVGGAIASIGAFPARVDAGCSGNPHDFDSGSNGNPHDSENGNLENGNPHDLVGDFHHHQTEDCPGAK